MWHREKGTFVRTVEISMMNQWLFALSVDFRQMGNAEIAGLPYWPENSFARVVKTGLSRLKTRS